MPRKCLLLLLGIFSIGCLELFKKPDEPILDKPTQTIISADIAFNNYKKEIAKNYLTLADRVDAGEFEYVAQMVDAYKLMDKASREQVSIPINERFEKEIGGDELNKENASRLLRQLAKELKHD